MTISIITPLYKAENFIERCADSLFGQTFTDIEYIFVDDCSPDSTVKRLRQVLDRYPARKPQTKIIGHERNRGVAAARNTGLDAATGDYVYYVDADDYIEPDAIEAYKEYLFPLATIITPNYREANLLLKHDFCGENPENDMKELCQWGNAAIVKSIPYKENLMDTFSSKDHSIQKYVKEKINTKNVNGTGCTFSSSIAAFLSQGHPVEEAVRLAEDYIHNAIKEGATYKFGSGIGPVTHFYKWLKMS